MFQLNKYKKECHLDKLEWKIVNEFLKALFEVEDIISVEMTPDLITIEGLEKDESKTIGSRAHREPTDAENELIEVVKELVKKIETGATREQTKKRESCEKLKETMKKWSEDK